MCPGILILLAIDDRTTHLTGLNPLVGLDNPGRLASLCTILTFFGTAIGYSVGGMVASVFYVLGKLSPNSGVAGVGGNDPIRKVELKLLAQVRQKVIRCFQPYQPEKPLKGALATFCLLFAIAILISPFVTNWISVPRFLIVAGIICLLSAIASGNFQLRFYWPLLFCVCGCCLASWPNAALFEVPFVAMNVRGVYYDVLRFIMPTLGGVLGLLFSSVVGWLSWAHPIKRINAALLLIGLLALLSASWLTTNRIQAWKESPKQELLKKVVDDGGTLYTWFPQDYRLHWIKFSSKSTDADVVGLIPYLDDKARPPEDLS